MSMVPLNFGAAAPFKLKPHFWHAVALSSFCVPQFGQNTLRTSGGARRTRLGHGGAYTCFRRNLKSAGEQFLARARENCCYGRVAGWLGALLHRSRCRSFGHNCSRGVGGVARHFELPLVAEAVKLIGR